MDAAISTTSVDLTALNYAALQELAKKCGVRANVKAYKLRDNLRVHLKTKEKTEENESKKIQKRVRKRTFDLAEAALGSLTPEIDVLKVENGLKSDNPPAIKWKLIDDERPVDDVTQEKRVALRPQRILRKRQIDLSKIPRATRIANESSMVSARKATPDFARIHKRIFDKMDSVDEYVEKKRFRAKALQNGDTPSLTKKKTEVAAKRAIFVPTVLNVKDANFNFAKNAPVKFKGSKIPISKSMENQENRMKKPLDHRQIYKARKVKSDTSRRDFRQYVKGVRTNRRFDLQMQMRTTT